MKGKIRVFQDIQTRQVSDNCTCNYDVTKVIELDRTTDCWSNNLCCVLSEIP